MTLEDLANQVFLELEEPADISVASISYWFQTNLGNLNNLLSTTISIDNETLQIDSVSKEEENIFKTMYYCYYYRRQGTKRLQTAMNIIKVREDGREVQVANPNQAAKEYMLLAKEYKNELYTLVDQYKRNNATPRQVTGDDDIEGYYTPYNNHREGLTRRDYPWIS